MVLNCIVSPIRLDDLASSTISRFNKSPQNEHTIVACSAGSQVATRGADVLQRKGISDVVAASEATIPTSEMPQLATERRVDIRKPGNDI